MHFGMSADADIDLKSQELQRKLIDMVKPDLVVITGDGAQRQKGTKRTAGWFEKIWKAFTLPIVEAGLPYIYTLGNHDDEGDLDRVGITLLDQTNPLSLRGVSEGIENTTNFYVPVYSSQDSTQLAANLWVFDSGSKSCEGYEDGYGCIVSDAIDWYNTKSHELREEHGENVHHLAFFHIAIPEYLEMRNNYEIYGIAKERVCCPLVNTGFFDAVKRNGDISAMFVGHDHYNDFGGFYEGVELAYGRKSGYGSYGNMRGARVIKLKENSDSEGNLSVTRDHYVIDESGSIEYTTPVNKMKKTQDSCPSFKTVAPPVETPSSDDTPSLEDPFNSLDSGRVSTYSQIILFVIGFVLFCSM